MHVYMLQQLAADRVQELRADASRVSHQRARHDELVGQARVKREWRVRLQALFAR